LAGGLLGALGAAGAARAANLVRGVGSGWVGWTDEALHAMTEAALLRYLAVAHFGRGRGDWAAGESPLHWRAVVTEALAPRRTDFAVQWAHARDLADEPAGAQDGDDAMDDGAGDAEGTGSPDAGVSGATIAAALARGLQPLLADATLDALQRLYPDAYHRAA
ncbi:MAG: hypothetical protein ABIX12_10040, partial [Rubrivivax sp.]